VARGAARAGLTAAPSDPALLAGLSGTALIEGVRAFAEDVLGQQFTPG